MPMTPEENKDIGEAYDGFVKAYDIWWNERDSNMEERRKLNLASDDDIEKSIRVFELEHRLQTSFCNMIASKVCLYKILKNFNFTKLYAKNFFLYKITREENGILKSYDISK